jgi:vacuolar-type H+-ATPase subunit I/STV1
MITKINAVDTIDLKTATYDELSTWLQGIEGIDASKVPSLDEAMLHVEDMVMKHTSNIKEHSDLVGTKIIEMAPTIFATATDGEYENNGSFTLGIAEGEERSASISLQGSYSQAYIPTITITDQYGRVVVDSVEVIRLVHDNSDTTNRLWEFTAEGLENGTYTVTVTTKDLSSSIEIIAGTGVDEDMQVIMDWADDSTNPEDAPTKDNYNAVIEPDTITDENLAVINEMVGLLESKNVDSVDEIEKLADLVDIAQYADSDGTQGDVDTSDFEALGIDGVTDDNVADILDIIKDLEIEDIMDPANLQDIVDRVIAQDLIEDYADDNTNQTPSVEDYIKAGVVGVNADNLSAVNDAVDDATKEQVDTLPELQSVVNAAADSIASMSKIVDYAENNGTTDAPDATDYANINVEIPAGTTVADVNEIIATLEKQDVDTVAEIDAVVDSVAALNKIEAYAQDPSNPIPTVNDYTAAGVIGVSTDNLDEVNSAVDAKVATDVDTVPKLQAVINAAVDSVYAIDEIANYADSDGETTEPTLDTYEEAGVTGVDDGNIDEVNERIASLEKEDVDTLDEIDEVVESVNALNKIEDYANDSSRPIPTVSDYEKAGIIGVTPENISEVNKVVGDVTGEDVDTVEELQELINDAIDSVNAISQIAEYADTNGTSETPTLETYSDGRIPGVTADNIEEINDRIADLEKEDVDTKDEIKTVVDAVIALDKIEDYADSDTNSVPTVQDYLTAGIIGVNSENIGNINEVISNATAEEADTVSEVQSIVNAADARAAALAKIAAYVEDSVLNPAPTVSDYNDVGVAGVTEHNLASVNKVVDAATCSM